MVASILSLVVHVIGTVLEIVVQRPYVAEASDESNKAVVVLFITTAPKNIAAEASCIVIRPIGSIVKESAGYVPVPAAVTGRVNVGPVETELPAPSVTARTAVTVFPVCLYLPVTVELPIVRFDHVGVHDVQGQLVPAPVRSFSGVIADAAIPVPSLNEASLVPRMFHLDAEGCSPNTTDQLAYAILCLS